MTLVHGEESLHIYHPPQIGATYEVTERIVDCQDKKTGAMVVMETELRREGGNTLDAKVLSAMFIRGLGGWAEERSAATHGVPEQ